MKHVLAPAILTVLLAVSCTRDGANSLIPDTSSGDRFLPAVDAAGRLSRTTSVVIAGDSSILAERYFHGADAESPQDAKSVTKTVMALVVGIALDRGVIGGIDDTIAEYLLPITDSIPPDKASITVRHLLTMTGGFAWEELVDVGGYTRWWEAPDQVAYLLATPLVHTPGSTFTYNSAGLHLLSVIIAEASGMSTASFASTHLFAPLGITTFSWPVDHQGYTNGGSGLRLLPRDMAKVGQLVLGGGMYQGRRVVSAEWVAESVVQHIAATQGVPHGSGYGYGWWIGDGALRTSPFAMGWGGQFVVVFPVERTVAVITSTTAGATIMEADAQWTGVMDLLVTHLVPALSRSGTGS